MTDQDQPNTPQLYLITPVGAAASTVGPLLADVMDRFPVACLRIPGAGTEDELGRLADLAREIAHARDVAVVIDDHVQLALRHGLDGVHLRDGARSVRYARKDAAEAGADYVSFGPCGASALGHGPVAELDLFQWWSEVIEVPVVAEGALTPALIGHLAPITDFIALGPEIWSEPDPVEALAHLWR